VISHVNATNAGLYCVEVTGACNGVTNCASLNINAVTTADPLASQTNCPGTTVSFNTVAHGSGPFTYQWVKDGSPLGGETMIHYAFQPHCQPAPALILSRSPAVGCATSGSAFGLLRVSVAMVCWHASAGDLDRISAGAGCSEVGKRQ